jgi:glycosyltransferase involved in cell wall biosynthesis
MTVLIAHPTRQHSLWLAKALQSAGLLHSYWTLLPDRRALSWLPASWNVALPSAVTRHSLECLPTEKVHTLLGPLLAHKLASRCPGVALSQLGDWAAWVTFDHWVARHLQLLRPRVVVGYEMCCTATFAAAKSLGIVCVLDAAAFHYSLQDRILENEMAAAKTWPGKLLRRRKHTEIEYADQIICVSDFAKLSYANAGVNTDRIVVNKMGCDIIKFSSPVARPRIGPPKFVFVGMPIYRKGFDLLAASYARLLGQYPDAELHVVGDSAMACAKSANGGVVFHGKLTHGELSKLFARMDCLVLPSRLESFWMVVVEALASGLPAIVSDHVGSSEAIRSCENGWVVPAGDEMALLERMAFCCRDIDDVRLMSTACARSSTAYDWVNYSRRSIAILNPLLG